MAQKDAADVDRSCLRLSLEPHLEYVLSKFVIDKSTRKLQLCKRGTIHLFWRTARAVRTEGGLVDVGFDVRRGGMGEGGREEVEGDDRVVGTTVVGLGNLGGDKVRDDVGLDDVKV